MTNIINELYELARKSPLKDAKLLHRAVEALKDKEDSTPTLLEKGHTEGFWYISDEDEDDCGIKFVTINSVNDDSPEAMIAQFWDGNNLALENARTVCHLHNKAINPEYHPDWLDKIAAGVKDPDSEFSMFDYK
jgi:hypothetical protein